MKFLIPTEPDDTHALVVKLALENSGHQATTIFTADQPTRQKNSIFVDDSTYRWQSADRYDMILENDYDVEIYQFKVENNQNDFFEYLEYIEENEYVHPLENFDLN